MDFFRDESSDRKKFLYPPFSTFIKLSFEGKESQVETHAEELALLFKTWEHNIYQSSAPSRKGNTVMNILIRLPKKEWPNPELERVLRRLPPSIAVRVDPDSLL